MPDRPRHGGPEEDPEYGWLYGDGGRRQPPPPSPDDATRKSRPVPPSSPEGEDHTRVMSTPPRQPRPSRPTPPPVAPPPGSGGGGGRPGRRRRFGPGKLLLLLLVAWLVFLIAVPLWTWSAVQEVPYEPDAGDRPGDQPGTTYLMVGSDSRADLSQQEREELNTGDAQSQLADTIMLLHTGSGPNLLMSIPRDSIVEIPEQGTQKINAAYSLGGPKLLTRTVESATGIRVDEYVEVGMGGLVGVVDAVGGIQICPDEAMQDPDANLDIQAGCQEADGATALGYARSRKTSQTGDIARAERQREVVGAVGSRVTSPWTVINPLRWWNLNRSTPAFFAFGEGTGPVAAGRWAWAMTRLDGDAGMTCGVPIADLAVNWDTERAEQLFTRIREDDTGSVGEDLCTPSGMAE